MTQPTMAAVAQMPSLRHQPLILKGRLRAAPSLSAFNVVPVLQDEHAKQGQFGFAVDNTIGVRMTCLEQSQQIAEHLRHISAFAACLSCHTRHAACHHLPKVG